MEKKIKKSLAIKNKEYAKMKKSQVSKSKEYGKKNPWLLKVKNMEKWKI